MFKVFRLIPFDLTEGTGSLTTDPNAAGKLVANNINWMQW